VIAADALRELSAAAGPAAVLEHEAIALDGVELGVTLAPADPDALAATLGVCARRSLPLVVKGGGTRLGIGNRPARAAAWLSTARLAPECRVDADEGVAWVGAATALGELAGAARAAGWLSPLEPQGPRSSVGGALATAASGPRALGLGRARDVVLGLEVVLASGERTRCGGRVVKNVSGYDLAKLYVGSFGTLGVISGAWLRLRPRPEAARVLAAPAGAGGEALALAAARTPGARAAALLDASLAARVVPGAEEALLLVELAGDAPVVEDAARALGERGAGPAPAGALDALCGLERDPAVAALRFRIQAPSSALARVRQRLRDGGAAVLLHPGQATALAFFGLARDDETLVDAAWRTVRGALAGLDASFVLEFAPAWAKQGRDVFGARAQLLPLMRALKRQFDPGAILNPGRFVGGI
jgi:glycolate oxidase FAD binding subunit